MDDVNSVTYDIYTAPPDKGPWKVGFDSKASEPSSRAVWLESDDFTHDVVMYVSGDFSTLQQQISYAEHIARKLNA